MYSVPRTANPADPIAARGGMEPTGETDMIHFDPTMVGLAALLAGPFVLNAVVCVRLSLWGVRA